MTDVYLNELRTILRDLRKKQSELITEIQIVQNLINSEIDRKKKKGK